MSSVVSPYFSVDRGRWLVVPLCQFVIVAAFIAFWQAGPSFIFDEMLVSRPSLVLIQTVKWLEDGVLLGAAVATLKVVLTGLLFGGVTGVTFGLAAALWRPLELIAEPIVDILFALPKSAFVPLFILWFGISFRQHAIFTATVVFFFFFFAMLNGVRSVPIALRNMLTLSGASTRQTIHMLYLPASFDWMLSGLRLAMPQAFLAAITAEVIASREGLGHLVKANAAVMNASGMLSALLCLVLLSVALSATALFLGKHSHWRVQ
jgi:NitT/TauT family transport system permease protein